MACFKKKDFLPAVLFAAFVGLLVTQPASPQKLEMQLQENASISKALKAFQSGDLERARKYFEKALERGDLTATETVTANNGLCATFMYLERYEEAIARCKISLDLNPNKWETLNNLGISYLGLGDFQKAIFYLERGLGLNADSKVLAANLEIARQRQQEEEIRLELEKEKAGGESNGNNS